MLEKNTRETQMKISEDSQAKEENLKLEKIKNYIKNLNKELKLKFWIKTLFASYSTLPEVIKTIDNIIELKASKMSFVSDIYNATGSPLDELERVIDLTERKNNLLNIYVMVKQLYKCLSAENVEIIEKKFLYGYSCEEVARDIGVSGRTIYRRIDKIIDEVYQLCKRKRWTLEFVEAQISCEYWLKQRFIKMVTEYFKNNNYTDVYSMSSSGS